MQLIPTGSETTIRGAFPVWAYSQVNARLIGIDAQAKWYFTKNGFWQSNFAYTNGKNLSNKDALIDMPPLNVTNSWNYTFIKWQQIQMQLKSELMFRQNRYPNHDFETMIPQNGELTPVLVNVSHPPPSYHLIHLQLEMPLSPSLIGLKKGQLTLGLQVQNIMNTSYRDYLNRMRFYADDLGRNFLIHLKLNF
jgi:iron complex outermembrane receptor protein